MSIVYMEESKESLRKIQSLKNMGYKVRHSDSFLDALSWLEDTPGAENISAFIFDLRMEASLDSLRFINPDEPYDEAKHYSPSMYFINYYMLKHYPHLKNRIILYSAYFEKINKHIDLSSFRQVNKRSTSLVEDLIQNLDELGVRP